SALVKLAGADPHALNVSAGSFRDLTRVAASGSEWWTEVLTSNAGQVEIAIADLQTTLTEIAADLAAGNRGGISSFLRDTGETRSHLAAPAAEVRVVLFDRPGEIARVGRALEESAVDLRDLQLRHAEHGGGGILTLSVGIEEVARLRAALEASGFELEAPG
ncbi:MAG: prephenate dehydrogenase/arogenate dehydrogenase family protein, partial [Acidimicrobiia bacterium]|nr:prephenate dehydrogenase/arogenate dehydrogenase family protein [Acidimicrobiia bacterium]